MPPAPAGPLPGPRVSMSYDDEKHIPIPPSAVADSAPSSSNDLKPSFFWCFHQLEGRSSRWILCTAIVCAMGCGAPLPIIGLIFGQLIANFPPPEEVVKEKLIQLMLAAIAYFAMTWAWAFCWGFVGLRICKKLRQRLMAKLMGMDLAYYEVESPDVNAALTTDINTVQLAISEKLGFAIQGVSYFSASLVVGFYLNPRVAAILLVAIILPVGGIVIGAAKALGKYGTQEAAALSAAGKIADESIKGAHVVQALNLQNMMVRRQDTQMQYAVRSGIVKAAIGGLVLGSIFFIAYGGYGLAFFMGSRIITEQMWGAPNVGTIFTIIFLILDSSLIVGRIGPILQSISLASRAAGAIRLILEHEQPENGDEGCLQHAQPPPKKRTRFSMHASAWEKERGFEMAEKIDKIDLKPGPVASLILHKVTFQYPTRREKVIDSISITFNMGQFNAVVGPSGAGKSTICSLLLNLYAPTNGNVYVNYLPLNSYNTKSIRSRFAFVQQHSTLFPGTILENIKLGFSDERLSAMSEEETRDRCIRAARAANAWPFICNLPDGLDTTVTASSGYGDLSGGEKQRLCLARALVSDPEVLILDEPTASLDVANQKLFISALETAQKQRQLTIIMITHRLETVLKADRIWVMKKGHVVEKGSPNDLLRMPKGVFRAMYKLQETEREETDGSARRGAENVRHSDDFDDVPLLPDGRQIAVRIPDAPESALALFKFALKLSRPEMLFVILGLFASICTGCCVIGEALLISNLINTLSDPRITKEKAVMKTNGLCLGFLGMGILAVSAYLLSGAAFGIVSQRLMRRVRTKTFAQMLRQDRSWATKKENSAPLLLSTLNSDTERLSSLSGMTLGSIVASLASLIAGIMLGHAVKWKLAIVILGSVPAVLGAGFVRIRILQKFEHLYENAFLECAALATGVTSSFSTVLALGKQEYMRNKFETRLEEPYKSVASFNLFGSFFFAFAIGVPYFAYALAYWWGGKLVRQGDATALQFFIVMFGVLNGAQASGRMFSFSPEIVRAISAAKNVLRIWTSVPTIDNEDDIHDENFGEGKESQRSTLTDTQLRYSASTVTFRNVNFAYREDGNPVLRGVNMDMFAGQFIAVVGKSGSGKSTIISLIERYWDVVSGSILVDGRDIRDVPVKAHRERVAIVPQESTLFSGSIALNISMGDPNFVGRVGPRKEIVDVCKQCGIHNFISSLPEGYDTECGPNGTQLSGGQRQRICLARALYNKKSSIMLLDEASSALDAESEQYFEQAIQRLVARKEKTVVMVTHRLSSIRNADQIFFMEKGRVVESGSHQQLMKMGGRYAALVECRDDDLGQ